MPFGYCAAARAQKNEEPAMIEKRGQVPENDIHGKEELAALALLRNLQGLLAAALDSLGGQRPPTAEAHYLSWAAVSVNRAAEGYLWLRQSGRTNASKLLVRPPIEAVLNATAVQNERGFLHKLAYTEFKRELKLLGDPENRAAAEENFNQFERLILSKEPDYPLKRQTVTIKDAAKAAAMEDLYQTTYAIYCKYAHGALRAATGDLDPATDQFDTHIVAWCVLTILDQLKS